MDDSTVKSLWPWFVRPTVGWAFDTDKLGGPRIGAEAGYFLKLKDKSADGVMSVFGLDFGVFGETDPTKPAVWATGGRFRWKNNYGLLSFAVGTGVSIRNSSTDGTSVQAGVPFDGQIGFLFDMFIIGGGVVYYPDAVSQHTIGEFKIGTDLLKVYTVLTDTTD
jgi:hypothetical protein